MAFNDSSLWFASDDPISGLSTSTTEIETVPNFSPFVTICFIPQLVTVEIVERANLLTNAVINIGTNSPNYNNIASAQIVGGVLGSLQGLNVSTDMPKLEPGTVIYCKVTTAATHLGSGECSFRPIVTGILV